MEIFPKYLKSDQRKILATLLILGTFIKLYLALFSPTSADANAFAEFLEHSRQFGSSSLYEFRGSYNNIFNFPPAMIYVIKLLGNLVDVTGLPLKFWLRLLPSLADVGTFLLVCGLLRPKGSQFYALALLAFCPISIFINGYEGNVDGLMMFFVVLSVWLVTREKPVWTAGIAFGLSISVKYVPVMFVPVFFFYLPNWKDRIQFFIACGLVFLMGAFPFLIQKPNIVTAVLLGYGSIYGVWGLSNVIINLIGMPQFLHPPYDPIGTHAIVSAILKYLTFGLICALSVWMNSNKKKPDLFIQCGVVVALFLFVTPGFGIQYLVWLVPLVTAARLGINLTYVGMTTIYLILKGPDVFSGSTSESIAMYGCWISTLIAFLGLWYCAREVAFDRIAGKENRIA